MTKDDEVCELSDIPQSSVGAPIPSVIATEHATSVTFYAQRQHEDWDGTNPRIVESQSIGELCVTVRFSLCYAHMFGPPNDEAFRGHPLYSHGLRPYGNYQINNSSWIDQLDEMNAVHAYHDSGSFRKRYEHYILAFHDSTFECVAERYTTESAEGSIAQFLSAEATRLTEFSDIETS